jgi:hypothetical protein
MPHPTAEARIARLTVGEQLFVMLDLQNPVDPKAIAVRTADNVLIGYLPAYLATDLLRLQESCTYLHVLVERVNPPPAEVHHRLLCKVISCWPEGFRPFDADAFRPMAASSAAA